MQLFTSKRSYIACYCKRESNVLFSAGRRETVLYIINYDLPHVDPVPRDRDEGHEHQHLESREVSRKFTFFNIK